uniref:Ig-like domain-containing protein n=1 Tax=Trichogramma kaykai TaxID=54128 RepID=A0ABD2WQD2_9HYME
MWRVSPVKSGSSLRPAILLFLSIVIQLAHAEDESMGPIFIKEPPNRVDFSNGTGAVIECQARGNPQPDIIWIRADGTAVGDVPGLRQVLPNGNLVFPPFRAEDYRQEVHAQVYICLARNTVGSIHSRDVNVRAVVAQYYDVDVNKEYAIRGNSAVLKCVVPSFVADFVSVLSWHTDQGEEFVRRIGGNADGVDDNYVVHQFYQSEVNNEYVIRGNAAILKCSIPSFVAEFVQIVGWQDDQGNTFNMGAESVVTQAYHPEIMTEYVIRGNSAILKCSIPSYVAEFVTVEAWISEDGETYLPRLRTNDSVVAQSYVTEAENEYVIRANSAIMKCKIPSFVSEFIQVDQWVASDGSIYTPGREYAVSQYFEVQVYDVFAIRGNAAIFKCQVPSFVGDYVVVAEWISSNDESFTFDNQSYDGKYLVLPSGELHIKDVGPEDGYKTYQCRTKHRLTGETRLSATKGRLVITEPTSNVAPRLAGERYEGGRLVSVATGRVIALLCAVQGSPAPIQRWYKFIEGTSRRQPVQLNERVRQVSGTLIILEAQVDDSGKYLCVVNNSVGGESVETVLTVTAPLAAEIEPRSQTIDFGRPATFTCNTKGNPIKTVSWLKDGKPIGHEDTTLKIESVKKDDKGMYQCFIRNDQESAQASAELKLGGRFEPPQIRSAFHEETLQPGPSVHLKCTASGNPTPEITWELDGKKLSNTERFQVGQYVTVNGDVVSNLNISSIHTNDGGLYKCIASSKVGSAEHSARLNVYGLPFIRHMDKKAIVAGETLRVTCPVAGHPIESIVWERDTRVLPINRKQKVFQNGTLIIENVERMTDQATYTCVARNAQGYSARGTLEVQVMESPHIQPFTFTKVPMNAGDFANLQCIVPIGDLPLKIRWHYPGEKLGGASSVMVKKVADRVSMLMIPTITEKHAGDYVCQAENAAGSVEHRASLVVNVAPQLLPIAFNAETANEGDMVSVACSILKGDAPLNISWSFNGTTMEDDPLTGVTINRINKYLSTLSIESVAARHAGEYACRAQNLAGAVSHTTFLAVNVAPQILPFTFGDEPANWADLMSITCSVVKGDLPIDIGWAFNGEPLTEARNAELGVLVASTNRKNSVLSIESVQAKHVGEYACLATNRAGTATHAAHLAVNVLPQILEFSFGEAPLNSGEMLSLSCTIVKGDLPVHFTWLFDGRPVLDRSESNDLALVQPQLNVVTTPRVSFLSVDSVEARHAGSYTCLANNSAGHDSHTANLVVNVAPQIVPFEIADEPVNSGDSISVVCALVKGDLPIDISWSVDGQPVAEKHADVAVLATTKKNSILSIESVAARHAGVYTCSAANKAGAVSHSSILKVNVSPQIVPFTFGDAGPVNSGEAVSSVCTVSRGDQPLEFNWYLNGQLVDPEQRPGLQILTSKRRSLLEIEAVQASDAGEYTCSVSNQAGATSHSSVLAVNG